VLIGMDTRESGRAIAETLAGGMASEGAAATFAGVITTPAVAYLTRTMDFAAGVMISASHNPFEDNGIKVFSHDGFKLPDADEHLVEQQIFKLLESPAGISRKLLHPETGLAEAYLDRLTADGKIEGAGGIRVVADCANGAASLLAPRLFERLGIEAAVIANSPNGRNINLNCGSLHMDELRRRVIETGASIGVAFDGDADRALFAAEDGSLVTGDNILLLAASYLAQRGRLANNLVVTTVMANMGLEAALREAGAAMSRTAVGDKYVLEEMLESGAMLGGEQSGHIIFREFATTGDGLLTARIMLEILAAEGKPLSELARRLPVFPQTLRNLRVGRKVPFEDAPPLRDAVAASEKELGPRGRVVVRYSGTEPLVRIMVEADDEALMEAHASRLANVFERYLSA
jgi:phosphoglucosamine mutase